MVLLLFVMVTFLRRSLPLPKVSRAVQKRTDLT